MYSLWYFPKAFQGFSFSCIYLRILSCSILDIALLYYKQICLWNITQNI